MRTIDLRALGRFIRAARRNRAFSQQDLAIKANVAQQAISSIERGTVTPSLQSLDAIAGALEIDVFKLLQVAFGREDGTIQTFSEQIHLSLRSMSIPALQLAVTQIQHLAEWDKELTSSKEYQRPKVGRPARLRKKQV